MGGRITLPSRPEGRSGEAGVVVWTSTANNWLTLFITYFRKLFYFRCDIWRIFSTNHSNALYHLFLLWRAESTLPTKLLSAFGTGHHKIKARSAARLLLSDFLLNFRVSNSNPWTIKNFSVDLWFTIDNVWLMQVIMEMMYVFYQGIYGVLYLTNYCCGLWQTYMMPAKCSHWPTDLLDQACGDYMFTQLYRNQRFTSLLIQWQLGPTYFFRSKNSDHEFLHQYIKPTNCENVDNCREKNLGPTYFFRS